MTRAEILKQKRQHFHRLLLLLDEVPYKSQIIESFFGVTSTKDLTLQQLNELIAATQKRLRTPEKTKSTNNDASKELRKLRNKCLLVLNERGITATPKDWSAVNNELAKKQYQWILTPLQQAKGLVNRRGLYAFQTAADLQKLFKQLCSIRDNEQVKNNLYKDLALKN